MTAQAHSRLALLCHQAAAWLYGAYAWALFSAVILSFGAVIALLRRPASGRRVARAGARLLLRLAGMPVQCQGLEGLPKKPHILLVNHSSFLDGIVLTALLPATPGYAFVVRQQFDRQHWFCSLLHGLGTIVLNRADVQAPAQSNIDKMVAALARGENLIVFPEGGYRPEPGLRPFHTGALVAAAKACAPITVAALSGARKALRSRNWLPHRTALALSIGPSFQPDSLDPDAVAAVTIDARNAMLKLLREEQAAS